MHFLLLLVITIFTSHAFAISEQDFVRKLERKGFDAVRIQKILASATKQDRILELIARPAEKSLVWYQYRAIFLKNKRIEDGVNFYRQYRPIFDQAERKFGVPSNVILGILGVETFYGRIKGSYRVLDALYTLGFYYPKRGKFFRKQLEDFIRITEERSKNPLDFYGSYAGAMGMAQFIPSSYLAYAADYDGDNFADLWDSPEDAIWSIANYLAKHGYHSGEVILVKPNFKKTYNQELINTIISKPRYSASYLKKHGYFLQHISPEEKFILLERVLKDGRKEIMAGGRNFYVITRYNHSFLYAMAVYDLGNAVLESAVQQKVRK